MTRLQNSPPVGRSSPLAVVRRSSRTRRRARPLSEAVYALFWLVTLSGIAARRLLPAQDAGKPIRRAATIIAGLALPPVVLVAIALAG